MRTGTVRLTLACNQRCGFCISRDDRHDSQRFGRAALESEVDRAVAEGVQVLWLSGGEPTL